MTHEIASDLKVLQLRITFYMIVLHLNLTKFNVHLKMLSRSSSFPKGMSWHEKMECNRLEGSNREGRQGSRDAVRWNRPSKKGRKQLEGSRKSEDTIRSGSSGLEFWYFPGPANQRLLSELQIIQYNMKYFFNIKNSFDVCILRLIFSLFLFLFWYFYFFIDSIYDFFNIKNYFITCSIKLMTWEL